jgi:N-methylhydantoinase A/oxoprolinase/acetone carboxylase beta subunit
LERENASILNASILAFAQRTISGFQRAMRRLGLACPLFLTQNDGTLTSARWATLLTCHKSLVIEFDGGDRAASRLPIRTFSSGATNSMRGASFLAGVGATDTGFVRNSSGGIIVVDVSEPPWGET